MIKETKDILDFLLVKPELFQENFVGSERKRIGQCLIGIVSRVRHYLNHFIQVFKDHECGNEAMIVTNTGALEKENVVIVVILHKFIEVDLRDHPKPL
jgi:hypothetical protein